jgi:hypothetical protein
MSGSGDPGGPEITPEDVAAGQAMEVIGIILDDPARRGAYTQDPAGTFRRAQATDPQLERASYEAIPATTRAALEVLSDEELALLARIGRRFIEDGMYIDVPGVGKCYIK